MEGQLRSDREVATVQGENQHKNVQQLTEESLE